jgi:DNA repair protein RecO (recombination protein O)
LFVKTKAIVISSIRHQEKNLIVKCFTASDGMKSYYVRSAFGNKKGNQKIAYFQPLTILEIEASHQNKGTLEHFKEIKLAHSYHSVHTNYVKSALVLFIAEILSAVIREEEKNETLFEYLENALLWLDAHDHIVNFHLILLLDMCRFLGFYPDDETVDFPFFNLLEGHFDNTIQPHSLTQNETELFKRLLQLQLSNTALSFSANERQKLLKILLDFYKLHLGQFKTPKSLDVLSAVFS